MIGAIKGVAYALALIWMTFFATVVAPSLMRYGIIPRTVDGLPGIVIAPLLHANLPHLLTNSVGLIVFGCLVAILEGQRAANTVVKIALLTGTITWLIARPALHMGASGVIFGLFSYALFLGFWTRRIGFMVVSLLVLCSYGSMVFGVLPGQPGISWEGHLSGFLSGLWIARKGR